MKKIALIFIALLAPLLAVSLFFNYKAYVESQKPTPDTITVEKISYDTITITNPAPINEQVVGQVAVPVVFFPDYQTPLPKDTVANDSVKHHDQPPDTVYLPRAQREYSDSSYTAWVSGYDPRLDSIRVRERIVTHTITISTTKKEFRRWSIGLVGGYGYGFKNKSFEPFVGVGVTYNLFK